MNNNHRDKIRMRQRAIEKDKVPWRGLATVGIGAVLSSKEGTGDTGGRGKLAGEAASAQSQNAPRPRLHLFSDGHSTVGCGVARRKRKKTISVNGAVGFGAEKTNQHCHLAAPRSVLRHLSAGIVCGSANKLAFAPLIDRKEEHFKLSNKKKYYLNVVLNLFQN